MTARGAQIPRVFHRIWLGSPTPPEESQTFWETWKAQHPTWEFITWDEDTLPHLMNQRSFDESESWAQKADIARYEILLRYGGVYLDTDFECFKPIDPLLTGMSAFSASEDNRIVSIGIMGALPGHPWMWNLANAVRRSIEENPEALPDVQTGPRMATGVTLRTEQAHAPVVFDRSLFYPYHWGETHRRHETFPDAYAAHHWAASWWPDEIR